MQWDVNMHVNMCNNKYKILIKSISINSCKYIWNITNQIIYLNLHIKVLLEKNQQLTNALIFFQKSIKLLKFSKALNLAKVD